MQMVLMLVDWIKEIAFEFICINSSQSIAGFVETFTIMDLAYNAYSLVLDRTLNQHVYGLLDPIFRENIDEKDTTRNSGYYVTSLKEFDNSLIELSKWTEPKFQELPWTNNMQDGGDSFRNYLAHQMLISKHFNNCVVWLRGYAAGTQIVIKVKCKVIGVPKVGELENIYGV